MIGLNYIDYYIPTQELPVSRFLNAIDEKSVPPSFKNKQEYQMFIENILKLKGIRVEANLDEVAMIGGLIEKVFDSEKIEPKDIDIIIATQEPELVTQQNLAKILQLKYKMGRSFIINATGNQCANIEVAIYLASSILHNHQNLNNIMIISSNKAETIDKRTFGTYAVVGDGAGIMLMSNNVDINGKYRLRLVDNVIISNAKLYDADINADNAIAHCISYVKCISDLMEKNSISDDNIEKIIIQNANPLMISQCMASAGLDKKKIFTNNIGKYGHMEYVDFMINLKDALDEGIGNKDRYLLTFGTGSAGSYVACLFAFN